MKLKNITRFGLVALAVFPLTSGFCQTAAQAQSPLAAASFSTVEVVKLAHAGMGDDVVLAYVKSSQIPFNLSANDILTLKNEGVNSPVITAMLQHDGLLRKAVPAPVAYVPSQPVAVPVPAAPVVQITPPPPPAPQIEVVTVSPGPDYYWDPGIWSWNGNCYIWVGGRWGYRHDILLGGRGYYGGVRFGGHYAPRGHWR